MMRIWLLLFVLSSSVYADDEAELKQIQADIQKLQQWLKDAQSEYSDLDKALQQSDRDLADTTQKVEQTRQALKEEQARLKKLQAYQKRQKALQQQHRERLAQQVKAAHQIGQQGPLKLLLNQDDPQEMQRMMTYLSYLSEARSQQIQHTIDELVRLDSLEQLIREQQEQLAQTEQRLLRQNQQKTAQKAQQKKLLATLQKQMSNQTSRLQRKQADRRRLSQLLEEVASLLSNSARQQDARPFRSMKGQLPKPVRGRVLKAFGNRHANRHQPWQGWLVSAPEGTPVKAVHHGRVVFADWLRGFGLLVVVDHGQNYLSLYAHNQSIDHEIGSWINRGDVIGKVGIDSESNRSALYFEIRHKGKPIDPAVWLSRR